MSDGTMKSVQQLTDNLRPQTEQTRRSETTLAHSPECFAEVWRSLQAAKHISKSEQVGGTEFKYWRAFLKDLTNEQIREGRGKIADFEGYLTVGAFKKLCTEKESSGPYYNPYQLPAPTKGRRTPKDIAKERIAKIKQEHFGGEAISETNT